MTLREKLDLLPATPRLFKLIAGVSSAEIRALEQSGKVYRRQIEGKTYIVKVYQRQAHYADA